MSDFARDIKCTSIIFWQLSSQALNIPLPIMPQNCLLTFYRDLDLPLYPHLLRITLPKLDSCNLSKRPIINQLMIHSVICPSRKDGNSRNNNSAIQSCNTESPNSRRSLCFFRPFFLLKQRMNGLLLPITTNKDQSQPLIHPPQMTLFFRIRITINATA